MIESPKTLRIGPFDYSVERVDRLVNGSEKVLGLAQHSQLAISLDTAMAPMYERQALWHEALHLVIGQGGLWDLAHNEHLVESLANGVMQILRDNPAMRSVE